MVIAGDMTCFSGSHVFFWFACRDLFLSRRKTGAQQLGEKTTKTSSLELGFINKTIAMGAILETQKVLVLEKNLPISIRKTPLLFGILQNFNTHFAAGTSGKWVVYSREHMGSIHSGWLRNHTMTYGGFLNHRDTPSYHPFRTMDFSMK